MRKSLLASSSILAVSLLAGTAQAGTFIQIPPVPGSSSMIAFDIENGGQITGGYHDSAGIEHGFIGPMDGSNYTTFDFGAGASGTESRSLGYKGSVTGFATITGFTIGEEFFRDPKGNITVMKHHGQPMDGVPQGLTGMGVNMGDYFDSTGARVGYYGVLGKFKKDFNLHISGYLQNSPRSITHASTVAGYFVDSSGAEHGFVQPKGQPTQVIDFPDGGAILTVLESINDAGMASGQWDDSSGNPHAFLLNTSTGDFTTLDPGDGSTFQQSWGINGQGYVTVSTSTGASYVYCPFSDSSKCSALGRAGHVHTIHVAPGTFLRYDGHGRTARKLPDVHNFKLKGATQ